MSIKVSNRYSWGALSSHRAACYGFCAIWIVLFHAVDSMKCDFSFGISWLKWINTFLSFGNFGVDIFVLLSGISCFFSFSRNSDAGAFLARRAKRIIPSVLLICGTFWILWALAGTIAWTRVLYLATLVMPVFSDGGNSTWYVAAILLFYAAYPYIHEFIYSSEGPKEVSERQMLARLSILLFCISISFWMLHKYNLYLFQRLEIMCGRIPEFCIGAYLGHIVQEKRDISRRSVALLITCGLAYALFILFAFKDVWHLFWWHRLTMVPGSVFGGIAICMLAEAFSGIRLLKPLGGLCVLTGAFSLELYVAHSMCFWSKGLLPAIDGNVARALCISLLSWVIAWFVNRALYVWFGGGLLLRVNSWLLTEHRS